MVIIPRQGLHACEELIDQPGARAPLLSLSPCSTRQTAIWTCGREMLNGYTAAGSTVIAESKPRFLMQ